MCMQEKAMAKKEKEIGKEAAAVAKQAGEAAKKREDLDKLDAQVRGGARLIQREASQLLLDCLLSFLHLQ